MQGLVVTNSESWPKWVDKEQLKKHKKLEKYCAEQRTTLVEAAHQFINDIPELDRYIVGVCNCEQLEELIKARNKKSTMCIDTMNMHCINAYSDTYSFIISKENDVVIVIQPRHLYMFSNDVYSLQ